VRIQANGEIVAVSHIAKQQQQQVGDWFLSYFVASGEDNVYHLFNDRYANLNLKAGGTPEWYAASSIGRRGQVIKITSVSQDGEMEHMPLPESQETGLHIMPLSGVQVNRHEAIFMFYDGLKKWRLGRVRIP
ncbi:MAG: hypothetical protein AAFV07_11135, partial [Bacteroidota bacterium]